VPIADAYAPVDHWQWMATLWRGIVGADLVVYVAPRHGMYGYGVAGDEGAVGGGVGGTVGVKSSGLIVVRVPVPVPGYGSSYGHGQGVGDGVVVDEKMERRLGFEVVEWVRGAGWAGAAGRGVEGHHAGVEF
jgi:HMG box factor